MTNFKNNRELRRNSFDCRVYSLDADINGILQDLDNSDNPEIIKMHLMRVSGILEDYFELQLAAIPVTTIDVDFLRHVQGLLFDKYAEMI